MSTDRELLENAAKAAGYRWRWFGDTFCTERNADTGAHQPWNPLDDDGDALRLAVKLRINIYNPPGRNASASCWIPATDHVLYFDAPEDDAAATRRAIVRAAAAIAKAQP